MTLLEPRDATYARVNWSRWIADCPSPVCASALAIYRDQPWFQCLDCDAGAAIIWPGFADDIERLLAMRPNPITRNWEPGETLHDLLFEQLAHGILPAPLPILQAHAATSTGPLLHIHGDRIIHDALPGLRGQIRSQIGS